MVGQAIPAPWESTAAVVMPLQSGGGVDGDAASAVSDSDPVVTPVPAYQKDPPIPGEEPRKGIENAKVTTDGSKAVKDPDDLARSAARAMICALGPDTSFFYFPGASDTFWRYMNNSTSSPVTILPTKITALKIQRPYETALSPYGAGYFAYCSSAGGTTWSLIPIMERARPRKRKHRPAFYAAVTALRMLNSWLDKHVVSADDIRTTKVSFGPAGRFMAWRRDGTWIANDLPARLQAELKTRNCGTETKKIPQLVTFGAGDAWAAIWDDGTHTMELDGKYEILGQRLQQMSDQTLSYISLDCGGKGTEYYARFHPLKELHLLTNSRSEVISKGFNAVVRQWVIETGTDFTMSLSSNNTLQSRTILTAKQAAEVGVNGAVQVVRDSEALALEAAKLSIESSKKSIQASQVAVLGGVVAIAAGCTVM